MSLIFEKQSSGLKIRKIIVGPDNRRHYYNVGVIIRSNRDSTDYDKKVDMEGNLKGWYSDFHNKPSHYRYFDKAIKELKQTYMFRMTKRYKNPEDPEDFSYSREYTEDEVVPKLFELNEFITVSEIEQIRKMLKKMNSVKFREKEIKEFQKYAKSMLSDLSYFIKGTTFGKYSANSIDKSLREQAENAPDV